MDTAAIIVFSVIALLVGLIIFHKERDYITWIPAKEFADISDIVAISSGCRIVQKESAGKWVRVKIRYDYPRDLEGLKKRIEKHYALKHSNDTTYIKFGK